MTVPTIDLNDGTTIPQLGFGTFQVEPDETADTVAAALDVGYRHIDTAQMYGNEAGVGEALAASKLAREDLYVTTKLNNNNHRTPDVRRSLEESLSKLQLDRVDLFLIHWPLPTRYDGDYVGTWKAMLEAREAGLATSVGVSNFEPAHLEAIINATGKAPAVNQIEVHPFFANSKVRAVDNAHGIATEAWSPIAQGEVLGNEVLEEIAERLGKSSAQVTLRWHLQRGDIVFPKSVSPERMKENFELFDFELTEADMGAIDGLDQGATGRMGPDPDTFDTIPD